jgi:vancomycin resistance protein YoaR
MNRILRWIRRHKRVVGSILVVLLVGFVGYLQYFDQRMVPGVSLGSIRVGGYHQDEAARKLNDAVAHLQAEGIDVTVQDVRYTIDLRSAGFDVDIERTLEAAFERGHTGSFLRQGWERVAGLWQDRAYQTVSMLDETIVRQQIDDIALHVNSDARDLRLSVTGATVTLLTDTQSGVALEREDAYRSVMEAIASFHSQVVVWHLVDQNPRASLESADEAVATARRMIASPITLSYEDASFTISRSVLGSWIVSTYEGDALMASMSMSKIAAYATTIGKSLNVAPIPPEISTTEGRVTGFVPAKVGRSVQEDVLIGMIARELNARAHSKAATVTFIVPVTSTAVGLTGLDDSTGIKELIGRATTPFTGSPRNRISNIKNGVRFLSGAIVEPGAEFSTLATLGVIDNTTGYLPELVIKGDRTIPEFGGGLCQVSTTLFRAVLDAGLPVTQRRNHSFRVSYYEKDGTGKSIGPGLDATIYEPDVDFRFRNTTEHAVLVIGYVAGDKVTFELYGTRDGRTASVVGPIKLSETPSGDPIYTDDPELPKGTIKQLETAHPGGSAIATYTITYPDGSKEIQEFKSWYRPWPARYAVGTKE